MFKIYYDGVCHLCSREMSHYKKIVERHALSTPIAFIDISDPRFDAKSHGLDPKKVQAVMHVQAADGKIYQGVEAFLQIWQIIPGQRWLFHIGSRSKPVLKIAYAIFARLRRVLPKKTVCYR